MKTAIRKTISIPADRRLYLELPETTPVGRAEIVIRPLKDKTPTDDFDEYFGCFKGRRHWNKDEEIMPALEDLEADAAEKAAEMSASGTDPLLAVRDALHGEAIFNEDGVSYQRRIRDEWRI